jgi:hypothetical protein
MVGSGGSCRLEDRVDIELSAQMLGKCARGGICRKVVQRTALPGDGGLLRWPRQTPIPMKVLSHVMTLVAAASAARPVICHESLDVNSAADGGLRPVVGTHDIQVYRANRTKPEHCDGLTDTYVHRRCSVSGAAIFTSRISADRGMSTTIRR